MNKSARNLLFVQTYYVVLALLVAAVIWIVIGNATASFKAGPWTLGGSFPGFCLVWWSLNKTGLLGKLAEAAGQTVKAEILSPSTREHYDKLFAGIESCDYKAFNPPFRIEGDPNTKMYQDALATHAKRYTGRGHKRVPLLRQGKLREGGAVFQAPGRAHR